MEAGLHLYQDTVGLKNREHPVQRHLHHQIHCIIDECDFSVVVSTLRSPFLGIGAIIPLLCYPGTKPSVSNTAWIRAQTVLSIELLTPQVIKPVSETKTENHLALVPTRSVADT